MGKFFKNKWVFFFFVTFIFFFVFLFSSNQFTIAGENLCKKQDGTTALVNHYACGKDTLYYQTNPNKIYMCVNNNRGGLTWAEEDDCGNEGCKTDGSGANCLGEGGDVYTHEDEKNKCLKSDGSQASQYSSSCGKDTGYSHFESDTVYICNVYLDGYKQWAPAPGKDCGNNNCVTTGSTADCDSTWGTPPGPAPTGTAPPEITGILPVIYNAIKFFFSFIAVIAAAMVVYGAYMWMFSGGDPQKVKLAQGTLTWAIIGLIFFIMIVVFFDFILRLFGITMPKPTDTGIF